MYRKSSWSFILSIIVFLVAPSLHAQQSPDQFRWIDFRSQNDRDILIWITSSMEPAQWTSIREVGVIFDSALVVTADRPNPQAAPNTDTFTIWNASLVNHSIYPLVKGVNLRWLGWIRFAESIPPELSILYDNCTECAASTYFTSFHYESSIHAWTARWMHGEQGALLSSASATQDVNITLIYALLADPNGQQFLGTWSHFDFGNQKPTQDIVYRYEVDTFSHMDRTQPQMGKQADDLKKRICQPQNALYNLAGGQDSPLCTPYNGGIKYRPERRPVTTPPANNQGRSTPPGARR